jgi:hypothetical protein
MLEGRVKITWKKKNKKRIGKNRKYGKKKKREIRKKK